MANPFIHVELSTQDLAKSKEVTAQAWKRRPVGDRLKEWTAGWWEYWL